MLKIEKKPDVLIQVENAVNQHPFSTIENMREFIDAFFHDLWKVNGRPTDAIRTGKHHRASV